MLGLPLLVDVLALISLVGLHGDSRSEIDLTLPVDLVIDHSLTVEHWTDRLALANNQDREFEINYKRFAFIKACEKRFKRLRVIPPGGIMHQVNLEYLAKCVTTPDTNVNSNLLMRIFLSCQYYFRLIANSIGRLSSPRNFGQDIARLCSLTLFKIRFTQ